MGFTIGDLDPGVEGSKKAGVTSRPVKLELVADLLNGSLPNGLLSLSHQTAFQSQPSSLKPISASIVQGSAIGPAVYVATAGDLQPP